MKNKKLLGSKLIHPKKIGSKFMVKPKMAGYASFRTPTATASYSRPNYSFSSN